jgi:hypothetical protein
VSDGLYVVRVEGEFDVRVRASSDDEAESRARQLFLKGCESADIYDATVIEGPLGGREAV